MRLFLVLCLLLTAAPAQAGELAARACAALSSRVGSGPVFLASYEDVDSPALAGAAFTYDNALAAIALMECGHRAEALRIGEALLIAATSDRAGDKGRLRNAYRAGPQNEPPPPHGWWDGAWLEDAYQVGTATGNVAWAGLALMDLFERTGDARFQAAAARLGEWVLDHARDGRSGFTGGVHGEDVRLGWKSTEHNVDLAALFDRLAQSGAPGPWRNAEAEARAFVATQFRDGHFLTGTLPDGITPNTATSGLDAQLWPLLLRDPPREWRQALDFARRAHGVPGGFDFNDDRDGLWVEGTAQAALVMGERKYLAVLAAQASPGGLLYATREARITTGLAIGPDSVTDDFLYFRKPHLGATAWAILADLGRNPFRMAGMRPVHSGKR